MKKEKYLLHSMLKNIISIRIIVEETLIMIKMEKLLYKKIKEQEITLTKMEKESVAEVIGLIKLVI